MTLRHLINSVRSKIPEAFSPANLHISPLAKTGASLLAGTYVVSKFFPEETKTALVDRYIAKFHQCVDPASISEADARTALWKSYQGGFNVIATSPLFYSLYHFIHSSKLPMKPVLKDLNSI